MTTFLLIRHAMTDLANVRLSGRTPGVPLNDVGKRQAALLAESLAGSTINAVYSSPLERALETATAIAAIHQLQVVTSNAFNELDFGTWTNKLIKELEHDDTFGLFNTFRSVHRPPEGELMLEAQARFVAGMQMLSKNHPSKTLVVVSHSDMIKSALAHYLGIHLDLMYRLEISPASISIVDVFDDSARVRGVNAGKV